MPSAPTLGHDALVIALQQALAALCGVTALAVLVQVIRDRLINRLIVGLLVLIELGLIVHLVMGLSRVGDAPEGVSIASYVGYLVVAPIVLPLAVGWSWAERSRSGTATILVGLVLVPYLFVRLYEIWYLHP